VAQADIIIADEKLLPQAVELYNQIFRPKHDLDYFKRRFLGRYNDLVTRHAIYETDDALEIDEQDNFEIVRKRVFFEDVLLVTMHERTGIVAIFFSLGFAAFLGLIAVVVSGGAGWVFAAMGLLPLVYGIVRIARKETIITVFGRRSKARIRFSLRKTRAHQLYGELCAHVRRVQTQRQAQEEPSSDDVDQNDSIREG